MPAPIYLGTVALEPNRWGQRSADRAPHLALDDWLDATASSGFDGVELWEHHATLATEADLARLLSAPLSVPIYNSYLSLVSPDDSPLEAVAHWVGRLRCRGLKYNVGDDSASRSVQLERLRRLAAMLGEDVRLICECHHGTAAEDPAWAAAMLDELGPPDRHQALVHLGDDPKQIDAAFAALGARIRHVHVNFLRQGAPRLAEIAEDVRERVKRLAGHGFAGSYTIEFVHGVGGPADEPAATLRAAIEDLAVLRELGV